MAGRGEADAAGGSRGGSSNAGTTDWGRWVAENFPPPPLPPDSCHIQRPLSLLPPLGGFQEYFTIDVGRDRPEQAFGLKVLLEHEKGLRVDAVIPTSIIGVWNASCSKWFPRDELRVNDVIIKVNGEKVDPTDVPGSKRKMVEELRWAKDTLLLVLRDTMWIELIEKTAKNDEN